MNINTMKFTAGDFCVKRNASTAPAEERAEKRESQMKKNGLLRGRGLGPQAHAPSMLLPLRFVIFGLLSLMAGVLLLTVRPDILATYHYNQYAVAATHIFVLGWIGSVIMGATYQLVPVALETKLHSERLAAWHFILHGVGVVGMIGMFWVWNMKQVGHFGSAVGLGIGLLAYNIGRTLVRLRQWNVVAFAIASSLFWLVVTMLVGLYLAADKCWMLSFFNPISQMHAHAHLGVLGFVLQMMVGVSYKLVPMFTISEVRSARRAAWSIGLLNAGVAGLFVSILLGAGWKFLFAGIAAAGFGVYGWEIIGIVRARKRRDLDWGLKYFLTAVGLLAPLSVLGLALAYPRLPLSAFTAQLETVYALLAFLGVATLAILGMLYKILPFLVWYARYSGAIGKFKVPALADLYSPGLQKAGYWLYLAGFGAMCGAAALGHETGVRWGCALFAANIALFGVNAGKILVHLRRPRLAPLRAQTSHS